MSGRRRAAQQAAAAEIEARRSGGIRWSDDAVRSLINANRLAGPKPDEAAQAGAPAYASSAARTTTASAASSGTEQPRQPHRSQTRGRKRLAAMTA